MISFENTETYGWEAALRGMRNPLNSWEKGDSERQYESYHDMSGGSFTIGPNDYDLMKRLRNAGTDHRKFMRMIMVSVDITAPFYWWKEFDTYKIGTVANSCSTMHKVTEKEFTLDDFSHEHFLRIDTHVEDFNWNDFPEFNKEHWDPLFMLELTIKMLNFYREKYLWLDARLKDKNIILTTPEREHLEAKKKAFWWQIIQLLGTNYNQKRTIMTNYEMLANAYKSRKNHKLDEWALEDRGILDESFCQWIESLPYSEFITGIFGPTLIGVDVHPCIDLNSTPDEHVFPCRTCTYNGIINGDRCRECLSKPGRPLYERKK